MTSPSPPSTKIFQVGDSVTVSRNSLSAYIFLCRTVEVAEWILRVFSSNNLQPPFVIDFQNPDLFPALKNGAVLCQLVSLLDPKNQIIPRTSHHNMFHIENNAKFLQRARNYGVDPAILFSPIDLADGKNMPKVVACLHSLGLLALTKGFKPKIINREGAIRFSSKALNRVQKMFDSMKQSPQTIRQLKRGNDRRRIRQAAKEIPEQELISSSSVPNPTGTIRALKPLKIQKVEKPMTFSVNFTFPYYAETSVHLVIMPHQWHQTLADRAMNSHIDSPSDTPIDFSNSSVWIIPMKSYAENTFWRVSHPFPISIFADWLHFDYRFCTNKTTWTIDPTAPFHHIPSNDRLPPSRPSTHSNSSASPPSSPDSSLSPKKSKSSIFSSSKSSSPQKKTNSKLSNSFFSLITSFFSDHPGDSSSLHKKHPETTTLNIHKDPQQYLAKHVANLDSIFNPLTHYQQSVLGNSERSFDLLQIRAGSLDALNEQFYHSVLCNYITIGFDTLGNPLLSIRSVSGTKSDIFTFGQNNVGQLGQYETRDSDPRDWSVLDNLFKSTDVKHTLPVCQKHDLDNFGPITTFVKKPVLLVSSFHQHILLLTDFGVYGWGINTSCQLGAPDRLWVQAPRLIHIDNAPNILNIAAGGCHSLLLTEQGKVYVLGLGFGSTNKPTLLPFDKITQIDAGFAHAALLDEGGNILLFGWNRYGQTGQPTDEKQSKTHWVTVPTKIFLPEPCTQVSCGYAHTIAVGVSGKLYAWGWNKYGQCGVGNLSTILHTPMELEFLINGKPVFDCATIIKCSFFHSAAIVEGETLFVWGYTGSPGLGLHSHLTPQLVPMLGDSSTPKFLIHPTHLNIPVDKSILNTPFLSLGPWHCFFQLQSTPLMYFGCDFYGCAGCGDLISPANLIGDSLSVSNLPKNVSAASSSSSSTSSSHHAYLTYAPTRFNYLSDVSSIACGDQFTIFLAQQHLYSCGKSNFLGASSSSRFGGNNRRISFPTRLITFDQKSIVEARGRFTVGGIVTAPFGQLWLWGSNEHNIQGLALAKHLEKNPRFSIFPPHLVPSISNIRSFDIGLHHIVAVDNNGLVYSWGVGERGQLGRILNIVPSTKTTTTHSPKRASTLKSFGSLESASPLKRSSSMSPASSSTRNIEFKRNPFVVKTPHRLSYFFDKGIPCIQVACGCTHTLFLDSEGLVYGCGSTEFGVLTNLGTNDILIPTPLTALNTATKGDPIVSISAGYYHSLALTVSGALWSFGGGFVSDATFSKRAMAKQVDKPKHLNLEKLPSPIKSMTSGSYHAALLLENGQVATFGMNHKGQCGVSPTSQNHQIRAPSLVVGIEDCVQVSCGEFHTLCICQDGHLYGWGIIPGYKETYVAPQILINGDESPDEEEWHGCCASLDFSIVY